MLIACLGVENTSHILQVTVVVNRLTGDLHAKWAPRRSVSFRSCEAYAHVCVSEGMGAAVEKQTTGSCVVSGVDEHRVCRLALAVAFWSGGVTGVSQNKLGPDLNVAHTWRLWCVILLSGSTVSYNLALAKYKISNGDLFSSDTYNKNFYHRYRQVRITAPNCNL